MADKPERSVSIPSSVLIGLVSAVLGAGTAIPITRAASPEPSLELREDLTRRHEALASQVRDLELRDRESSARLATLQQRVDEMRTEVRADLGEIKALVARRRP